MRKFIISTLTSILISACGSSDTTTDTIIDKNCTVIVTGTIEINGPACEKSLGESNATVTIQTGTILDELIIEGSNSIINFETGAEITLITVNGNDNTLFASLGNDLFIDNDNGSGNSVIIQ